MQKPHYLLAWKTVFSDYECVCVCVWEEEREMKGGEEPLKEKASREQKLMGD